MRRFLLLLFIAGCARSATVIGRAEGVNGRVRIAAAGTTIVAASTDSLSIIDASNPGKPRITGTVQLSQRLGGIANDGRYAYVASSWQFRTTIFVVDLQQRRVAGSIAIEGSSETEVTLAGRMLIVSAQGFGLWLVDVADPAKPRIASHVDITAMDAVVNGKTLVVASGAGGTLLNAEGEKDLPGGVQLFDLATLARRGGFTGLQLGNKGYGANVQQVVSAGRYAYAGAAVNVNMSVTDYLAIVDVVDMRVVAMLEIPEPIGDLLLVSDRLHIAGIGNRSMLITVDVANPSRPKIVRKARVETESLTNLASGPDGLLYAGTSSGVIVVR